MPVFFDNLFPWFGDMLELGGDILMMIIIMAAFMWALIIERLIFFGVVLPSKRRFAYDLWVRRAEHSSWYAGQFRQLLLSRLSRDMNRNLTLIRTMVKV